MDIEFREAGRLKEKPQDESKLGFGRIFSDYMFSMNYTKGEGWHDPRITEYEDLKLSPACTMLHYSQEVFEGLKAYRSKDGHINLFRAKDNFARMNHSAQRMAMPPIDEEAVLEALRELVKKEQDWVPHNEGTSLYIRPNYISTDSYVGVRAGHEYLFYIIVGPVGAYYAHGMEPVRILIEKTYSRTATLGGTGAAKTGGNYAASLIAEVEANKEGCDQVLWLDDRERKYVQEVGSMNIMFVIDGKLVTPPLDGGILPGITRDSVLKIARSKGMDVEERPITVDELVETARDGRMSEAFGTGTAAVISPIGEFVYEGEIIKVADGKMGPVAKDFYDTLTGIQYGDLEDPFGWVERVV